MITVRCWIFKHCICISLHLKLVSFAPMAESNPNPLFRNLTEEELLQRRLTTTGRKHPVRARLEAMRVGEILEISRAAFQWKRKNPGRLLRDVEKKHRMKFEMWKDLDRKSWVVRRVG